MTNKKKQYHTGEAGVDTTAQKAPRKYKKEAAELEWEPKDGIIHIPDDMLVKAARIADSDLITGISFKTNDEGNKQVVISYTYKGCSPDSYKDDIPEKTPQHNCTRDAGARISTCTECVCGNTRCIPVLAGYIKYATQQGILDRLLMDREAYRNANNHKDENLLFTWEPADVDRFKRLPAHIYKTAEGILEKGLVAIRPYPDEDGRFNVDIKKIGGCSVKNDDKKVVGCMEAGPHNIKKELTFLDGRAESLPDGWKFKKTTCCCSSSYGRCQCEASICPYGVAAYMLYLRLTGQEDAISEAKKYSKEHPEETYYGSGDFKFTLSEKELEDVKNNIASSPQELLDAAYSLLDEGEAMLVLSKQKNKDGKPYYMIDLSKLILDKKDPWDCLKNIYEKDTIPRTGVYSLETYKNINIKERLTRLVAGIDYCRRKNIDMSDAFKQRNSNIEKFKEMSSNIRGLERVNSFIQNDRTSSLFCIVQGDVGSGKRPVVESIATLLSQTGKITSDKYDHWTMLQLEPSLNYTVVPDKNSERKNKPYGPRFDKLDQKKLYVLTGLDEFLIQYQMGTKENSTNSNYKSNYAFRHVLKTLGTFCENTYIIIVSLSKESTEKFLEIDKKFKYTYGQNIVTLENMSADELYDKYLEDLSDTVKSKIEERKNYRKRFREFIALNEKFLPFKNDALSHYLAEYSNVEGAPVLPPDVYNKKEMSESLNDMIGMQAVKERLTEFESYITFQKKAKAAGITVKQGNLHMQFLGNPGTGKTTIARIVAKMLYDIGILEENKLVEVERKDLVGQYTGQSAPKTAEKIKEAMGGVLFIDEAYSLFLDENDQYGREVIATLIKAMEDNKDKLIVIFAGYDKEMADFLKANSGIESRIGYTFHFDDYTEDELTEIFKRSMEHQNFALGEGVIDRVKNICGYYQKRKNFGNGRFVKKVEQQIILNHADNMDKEGWDISLITADEVPDIRDFGVQTSGEKKVTPLDQIIGMKGIKAQLKKFQTKIQFEHKAKNAGAKIKRGNSHMLFLGNPGTGKTTIARIVTNELYEAGVILENKLIEVERKDLVGQYLGQTAPKTSEVIEKAMGGVLFIDEAYSLVDTSTGHVDIYGQEAISTLIKAMEDHKDEFVVIFAGYEKEMRYFLEANSGITSRIGYTFTFDDYTADELTDIFKMKIDNSGLTYTKKAIDSVRDIMQYFSSVPNFGNGRFADRVVNLAIELHSERIAASSKTTDDDLLKITAEDIPTVKYMLDHMPDGRRMINPENIKESQHERTAIHELGHALMVKLLTPDYSIERITIAAEGNGALGYVSHTIGAIGNQTKTEIEADICIKMAGIAAEEVFLGEYGNGGTSDLRGATALAENMLRFFGMSKNGFAYEKELDKERTQELNDILKAQFERAKKEVSKHKDGLEKAKIYLLKNRTISDEEFTGFILPSPKNGKRKAPTTAKK